jgi:hypothetical protein
MNVEHRTSNIEHRMYSICFKKDLATRGASACASGLEAYGMEALRERIYPSKLVRLWRILGL